MAADEKILSYNDVVLRRSDLDILSGPYFLNDRIIEFYFSYLPSRYPSEDVLLVPPSISFWITNCPDPESLRDFVEPLNLPRKKLVIFPVNNNEDVTEAEGGTHWSLLAYERKHSVFVHHNSISGSNRRPAARLYNAVARFVDTVNSRERPPASFIDSATTPQQVNGYDCGLYVTAIARIICDWYVSGGSEDDEMWFGALKTQVGALAVSEMRKEIKMLINHLMAKKK